MVSTPKPCTGISSDTSSVQSKWEIKRQHDWGDKRNKARSNSISNPGVDFPLDVCWKRLDVFRHRRCSGCDCRRNSNKHLVHSSRKQNTRSRRRHRTSTPRVHNTLNRKIRALRRKACTSGWEGSTFHRKSSAFDRKGYTFSRPCNSWHARLESFLFSSSKVLGFLSFSERIVNGYGRNSKDNLGASIGTLWYCEMESGAEMNRITLGVQTLKDRLSEC